MQAVDTFSFESLGSVTATSAVQQPPFIGEDSSQMMSVPLDQNMELHSVQSTSASIDMSADTLTAEDLGELENAQKTLLISVVFSTILLFICPLFACCPMLQMRKFRYSKQNKVRRYVRVGYVGWIVFFSLSFILIASVLIPVIIAIVRRIVNKVNH